jgi:hypothetical protein
MNADLILVIKEGEIVEKGNHDQLLSLKGKYDQLWSKQTKNDDDDDEPKTPCEDLKGLGFVNDLSPNSREEELNRALVKTGARLRDSGARLIDEPAPISTTDIQNKSQPEIKKLPKSHRGNNGSKSFEGMNSVITAEPQVQKLNILPTGSAVTTASPHSIEENQPYAMDGKVTDSPNASDKKPGSRSPRPIGSKAESTNAENEEPASVLVCTASADGTSRWYGGKGRVDSVDEANLHINPEDSLEAKDGNHIPNQLLPEGGLSSTDMTVNNDSLRESNRRRSWGRLNSLKGGNWRKPNNVDQTGSVHGKDSAA